MRLFMGFAWSANALLWLAASLGLVYQAPPPYWLMAFTVALLAFHNFRMARNA
jgi:hypothetical protein